MQTIYENTVPQFIKTLGGLKIVLQKAHEHGLDEAKLLQDRLAPDMFPFVKQVQSACDNAKGAAARLAGVEAPKFDDTEATLADLEVRIDKTVAYLQSLSAASFDGAAERKITLPYLPGKFMLGEGYAREYALPNFYFHVAIAYALVRRNDVAIGKADYINGMPLQDL